MFRASKTNGSRIELALNHPVADFSLSAGVGIHICVWCGCCPLCPFGGLGGPSGTRFCVCSRPEAPQGARACWMSVGHLASSRSHDAPVAFNLTLCAFASLRRLRAWRPKGAQFDAVSCAQFPRCTPRCARMSDVGHGCLLSQICTHLWHYFVHLFAQPTLSFLGANAATGIHRGQTITAPNALSVFFKHMCASCHQAPNFSLFFFLKRSALPVADTHRSIFLPQTHRHTHAKPHTLTSTHTHKHARTHRHRHRHTHTHTHSHEYTHAHERFVKKKTHSPFGTRTRTRTRTPTPTPTHTHAHVHALALALALALTLALALAFAHGPVHGIGIRVVEGAR
jgi:hypothetical protein